MNWMCRFDQSAYQSGSSQAATVTLPSRRSRIASRVRVQKRTVMSHGRSVMMGTMAKKARQVRPTATMKSGTRLLTSRWIATAAA